MSHPSSAAAPWLSDEGVPHFDQLDPGGISDAVEVLLDELGCELDSIEADPASTFEGLVEPLERLGDRLGRCWGTVGHLMGVCDSDALREAHDAMQPAVVGFGLRLGQSQAVYGALCALKESTDWEGLSDARKRIVESLIRDARHTGVALEPSDRERFNEIQLTLADLGTRFSNHVLDATKAFSLTVRDPADVEGIPEAVLAIAAQAARDAEGLEGSPDPGPWRFTLEAPSFVPFMEHCRNRELREQLYRAFVTRASAGELDNAPLIEEILALRREMAQLLGYANFGELSLDSKMASGIDAVDRLLGELREASIDAARRDLTELQEFSRASGAQEELQLWDIAFWAERLREDRFDYSEEELRSYFPLPKVLEGLFSLSERLFGIRVVAADGEVPTWHPDVRYFRVQDENGEDIAAFYLDPFSRPEEKRGGAWMDECLGRSRLFPTPSGTARRPVAYLVCNQTPPAPDGRPSLMTFDEVRTLFHEFGHGLQHMLTRVDEGLASGIRNVEWDAVELPSQFMENWLYHRETLGQLAAHVETGQGLPDELFAKLVAARNYRAGSDMLRQIYFSCVDIELHSRYTPNGAETAFSVQQRIAQDTTILPPLAEDRFLCGFSHIFAGGYAAGYYSYKWAEVLSADAFGAFEDAGLGDETAVRETGHRYRETILALGGSEHPMTVFERFRGRKPTSETLLRHSGLVSTA